MRNYGVCVLLNASTTNQMLFDGWSAIATGADLLEIKLDSLREEETTDEKLTRLLSQFPNTPLILSNRHAKNHDPDTEGFEPMVKEVYERKRIALLQKAVDIRAKNPFTRDYVKIEENTFDQLSLNSRTNVIAHLVNYDYTPRYLELKHQIGDMSLLYAPKVIWLSTSTVNDKDERALLNMAEEFGERIPIVIEALGETDHNVKRNAPKKGVYFTPAALNRKSLSEPGQLSIRDLYRLWGITLEDKMKFRPTGF